MCLGKLAAETAFSLCVRGTSSSQPGPPVPVLGGLPVAPWPSCLKRWFPPPPGLPPCSPGLFQRHCPLQSQSREKGEQEADSENKGWAVWEGQGGEDLPTASPRCPQVHSLEDPVGLGPATGPLRLMVTLCPKSASFFFFFFTEIQSTYPSAHIVKRTGHWL